MVLAMAALWLQFVPAPGVTLPVEKPDSEVRLLAANLPDTSTVTAVAVPARAESTADGAAAEKNGAGAATALPAAAGSTSTSFASAVRSSDSLAEIRIADPDAVRNGRFVSPENSPSRRRWIALAVAEHAAASFDAYSTRLAISRGAVEADPLMRPFANSSAIYAAIQASPAVLDFAARRMQRSGSGFLRRTWWMPQAAATGMFFFSGTHNLGVARELR